MPLKLRPNIREALRPRIAEFVARATVTHVNSVDVMRGFDILWAAEELLPKSGPVRELLNRYVGERSLSTFIPDELRGRMTATADYNEDAKEVPLLDALNIAKAETLADELLDALEALPRPYSVSLPLPERIARFAMRLPSPITLGPHFRLVHDAEQVQAVTPNNVLGNLANALLMEPRVNAEKYDALLQVSVEGFVGQFGSGETADEAHGLLKSFFGLGLAVDLFHPSARPMARSSRLGMIVHSSEPSGQKPTAVITLTDAETNAIYGLSVRGRTSGEVAALLESAPKLLEDMGAVLAEPERHQALLRASRWLFDAHISEDPLLSFVQATVVLEILLGEKASSDEVGLTTLLANRCAYMIGKATSERDAILKSFKTLYSTRSQIVHTGKHRFSSTERFQLYQLKALGCRVIRAEMALALEEGRRAKRRAERVAEEAKAKR